LQTVLDYTKLSAIELKFLVKGAATFLKEELKGLIPGEKNFFKNFQIFNFETFPSKPKKELYDYGNKEIEKLSQHYLQNDDEYCLDKEIIIFQWKKLKIKLVDESNKTPQENLHLKEKKFLHYILSNPYFQVGFNGILQIIEIYSVLPCSNAQVERGFSAMNRIKTKIRNKLLPETLNELMILDLNGVNSSEWALKRIPEWFSYWEKNFNPRNLPTNYS